jgi:hypothetical protein
VERYSNGRIKKTIQGLSTFHNYRTTIVFMGERHNGTIGYSGFSTYSVEETIFFNIFFGCFVKIRWLYLCGLFSDLSILSHSSFYLFLCQHHVIVTTALYSEALLF